MNGHIYLIGNHPSDDTANKMKKAQHERRKREAEYAKH
jgi:hypothetical protein